MSHTTEWVIAKQEAEDQGRVFDFDAWIAERNAKREFERGVDDANSERNS